jgi:hypothetical protein
MSPQKNDELIDKKTVAPGLPTSPSVQCEVGGYALPARSALFLKRNRADCERALSYIPCLLAKLDGDPDAAAMLAAVLQAMRDGGYADGFHDAKAHAEAIGKEKS